jgi:hypothetical protein
MVLGVSVFMGQLMGGPAFAGDPVQQLLDSRNAAMRGKTLTVAPGACDAINTALAALPNGGTVRLMDGQYDCTYPVIVDHDNIALIGAGSGHTKLRSVNGHAIPVVIVGDVGSSQIINGGPYPAQITHDVLVGGLTVNGNFHSSADPGNLECWNPADGTSLNCQGDAGHFVRNNGLTVRRGERVTVRDLHADENYSGGIVMEKLSKDLLMEDFSASGNYYDGIAGCETTGSSFKSFDLHHNLYSGISMDCGFENNHFENGSAHDNGDNGVFSANVSHNTFAGLTVQSNKHFGFYIDGRRDQHGAEIAGTCDGIAISDTKILGGVAGIRVNFGCKGMSISNVAITQSELECLSPSPDVQWQVRASSCTDGTQTKPIDTFH